MVTKGKETTKKEVFIYMRNPNGFGTIKKLSGKRRRPFAVYVTTGFEVAPSVPKIDFLKDVLSDDTYLLVETEYQSYIAKQTPKAKQLQKCIGYYESRPEAMIALADYNKNPYDIDKRNTTFKQVYDILFESKFDKMKTKSKSSYVSAFNKCAELENIRMIELRKSHMQKVVDEYAESSKSTQKTLLKLFNAIFTFALENDICEKNYAEFVEVTSEKESAIKIPFSREEIEKVWKHEGSVAADSILLMIYTGVRIEELLEIKASDVNLEERYINVKGTKTKAADRIVPIHKKIMPILKRITNNGHIIKNKVNKKCSYLSYRKLYFDPFMQQVNMNHLPHECRHSFATYAAASKLNNILVKKIIGHSAQDLTQDTYTHAFIEDLIAEIDKFDI